MNKRNSDTVFELKRANKEKNLQVINHHHHHEYNINVLSLKTFLPLHSHFQVHTVKKKVLWLLSVPDVDDRES